MFTCTLDCSRRGGAWRSRARCLSILAAVTEADLAALALILDWVRAARGAGQTITVRNLPAGLVSLAALYGVDSLLPLEPTG